MISQSLMIILGMWIYMHRVYKNSSGLVTRSRADCSKPYSSLLSMPMPADRPEHPQTSPSRPVWLAEVTWALHFFSDANVGWVIQLYTKVWWSTPVFLVIWPLFASKKCLFTRSLPNDPHTWIVGDYSIPPPNQGNPNFGAWLLHSIFFVVNSHWTPFFWVRSQYLVGDIQCLLVKSTCLVMNSPNFLGKSQNFEDVLPIFASKIHPNLRKKRDLCDRGPRPNHLRQMKQLLRFAQHSLRSRAARCHVLELQVCPGCQFWFTTCSMPYIVYTSYPYIYIISIYIYMCVCVIYLCLAMFGKNISRFLLAAFAHFIELKRAVWIRFCVLG